MKLVAELSPPTRPMVGPKPAAHDQRSTRWKLLMAIGAAGLVFHLPALAKPIAGCLVDQIDAPAPASCLSPPERLPATRSTNQAVAAVGQSVEAARVTLDNIDAAAPKLASASAGGPVSSIANCSDLRGTHEAQSLILQTVQQQLTSIERNRRAATTSLNTLRSSGANEAQLSFAASRLTKINAVWSSLKGDVEKRTKSFNNSMSQLTKVCLRG